MRSSSVDRPAFCVDEVRFYPADPRDERAGLLGFLSFRLNGGLRVDGVTVRRALQGRLYLSFPQRRSQFGAKFFFVTPTDGETRREIERQVFQVLCFKESAT